MSVEAMAHVLRRSRAKGTAKLVLIGIANHDGDGGAWPSIATLATYANADRRTVQRAIRDLVDMGELVVHDQDGGTRATRDDRRPNRYTITVPHGAASVPPRDADGAAYVSPRGGAGVAHGAAQVPPEPSLNHPEPSSTPSPHAATPQDVADAFDVPIDLVDGFGAFWEAYPRKVGKAAARKAWLKATTRAKSADIVSGARRFAADPNREPAFTPHPTTWLNQDRWDDDPLPSRPGATPTTAARVAQGMDVARRMAESEGVRMIGGAW